MTTWAPLLFKFPTQRAHQEGWWISQAKALLSPAPDSSTREQEWNPPWYTPPFFGPTSARLYLNRGRERKTLEVWDWSAGKLSILYQAHQGGIGAFGFSPDGAVLATAWR